MKDILLDSEKLKSMLVCGAQSIKENSDRINELNVFPVPDGDTGTNMTRTVEGGLSHISDSEGESVGAVMENFAHGMLLGARGNSGVILSQIFSGIADALAGYDKVGVSELCAAFRRGVERSYGAVMNPTEGTILTVFRESTEYACKNVSGDSLPEDFLRLHIEEAERSLARTKELLPVLAEADVVDSGGAGYLCIAVGMYSALTGKMQSSAYKLDSDSAQHASVNIDSFTRESTLEYGYCTEFLLRLMTRKVDVDSFDVSVICDELRSMGGESIVAFKNSDIVKVHVHTFEPGAVLSACQKYGEFLTLKIENMSLSHTESAAGEVKAPKKKFSVVAVASGDGICSLFSDLGADSVITGGQTANPSAEEFIEAFDSCSGEHIIVFPNNKNVLLAARQAAEMWNSERVHIIPTSNLMQCYSALSVLTPGITDIDALVNGAVRAAEGVVCGEITCAVRDVTIDGREIKRGEYIAICDGRISSNEQTAEDALCKMLESIEDIDEREIITLLVGCDIDDDTRAEVTERLTELYPDHEITVYKGGQDVYCYYVSAE